MLPASCSRSPTTTNPDFSDYDIKSSYDRHLAGGSEFCDFAKGCGMSDTKESCMAVEVGKLEGEWVDDSQKISACLDAWTAETACLRSLSCEDFHALSSGKLDPSPCEAEHEAWVDACTKTKIES